ncbi:hypothetical protein [Arthrobacter sp. VKM Ac-2550]|uniref:hypothetical protein n=1 Tax=Crystallibacter permensis TaxID=1938888 RepID=UPI002227AC6B|nr:hypothetical protein [Arthrobacter sp. VKM Ac-2550]MCW2132871.1 hypothetical protein [Arthrobacter sp. VKM Ac-2550]
MADHRATTQTAYPWKATLRTVLEVGIPAFALVLIVIPQVLNILAEELGAVLPESVTAWLLAAAATVTLVAGALARIAAIPGVNALLTRIGLGAEPK